MAVLLFQKIKRARESPEGFEELKVDIIIIAIMLLLNIGVSAFKLSIANDYKRYFPNSQVSQTKQQEENAAEFAEKAILLYEVQNESLFTGEYNRNKTILNGFTTFLKETAGIPNVYKNKNQIICTNENIRIIFTVANNEITYAIQTLETEE